LNAYPESYLLHIFPTSTLYGTQIVLRSTRQCISMLNNRKGPLELHGFGEKTGAS